MFLVVQKWCLEDVVEDHGIVLKDFVEFSDFHQNDALRILLLD